MSFAVLPCTSSKSYSDLPESVAIVQKLMACQETIISMAALAILLNENIGKSFSDKENAFQRCKQRATEEFEAAKKNNSVANYCDSHLFPGTSLLEISKLERLKLQCLFGKMVLESPEKLSDFVEMIAKISSHSFESRQSPYSFYQGIHFVTSQHRVHAAAVKIEEIIHIWILGGSLKVDNQVMQGMTEGTHLESNQKWLFKKDVPDNESVRREIMVLKQCYQRIHQSTKEREITYPFPMDKIITMESISGERTGESTLLAQKHYPLGDLLDFVIGNPAPSTADKIRICKQIFYELWQPLFKLKMYHRDVKPNNIICLSKENDSIPECRLIDWATTQIRDEDPKEANWCMNVTTDYTPYADFLSYCKFAKEKNWKSWCDLSEKHDAFLFAFTFFFICTWGLSAYSFTRRTIHRSIFSVSVKRDFPNIEDGIFSRELEENLKDHPSGKQLHEIIIKLLDANLETRATFEEAKKIFDQLP